MVTNLNNNALKAGNQHWAKLHNLAWQKNSLMTAVFSCSRCNDYISYCKISIRNKVDRWQGEENIQTTTNVNIKERGSQKVKELRTTISHLIIFNLIVIDVLSTRTPIHHNAHSPWYLARKSRLGCHQRGQRWRVERGGSGRVESSWEADDGAACTAGARRRERGFGKVCHTVSSG